VMNDQERRGSLAGPDSVFTAFASSILTVPEGQCISKPFGIECPNIAYPSG
jgi:hypothetical protein